MYHRSRWTPEKIKQRLALIAPLVYAKCKALPSFRYFELNSSRTHLPIGKEVDDIDWAEISADTYWGMWTQEFILRTNFTIPEDWDKAIPIALYLPLGFAVESAWETNLLEENESELRVDNDSIQLNLRPYQIMTIRLKEKG